ncbi:MAG: DUF6125 family protein [Candidatus Hodarchaeales archaeon]|jgi:hypothetical protein
MDLEKMSKEELIKIVRMHAKNWLAHDGCWFQAIESDLGMERAIEYDTESWRRFTVIEARRIMKEFHIPDNGGLDALEKALDLRLYATINVQKMERVEPNRLIFKMVDCRVQSARERKKMPLFPCKPVGLVEYSGFTRTIDPRIRTKCLVCPPERGEDFFCGWEFELVE